MAVFVGTNHSSIGTGVKFYSMMRPSTCFSTPAVSLPVPTHRVDKSAYPAANQLPASVQDYMNKNDKSYPFLKAVTNPLPTGPVRNDNPVWQRLRLQQGFGNG